ncbi:hypothetical protein PACTADRAFT_80991 [Pachysolen tannophilus NRRL Y-2460]|uniref:DNA replication complex GINS protein SLD5 n=1 Tax=Pachysolen tannophilus NRRL Y-2460 TaxID=669874 RepID=A0A1E4TV44_PACTA|nr:hypothetical protein PACTADRAFT_80991 [Pachysolen tannophilus NRRL Y-2460]
MDIDDILKDFERQANQSTSSSNFENQLRQEDLQKLQQSWISERSSPEILPYEIELLERILLRLKEKIEFIEYNSIELQKTKDIKLKLMIIESEVQRINFLIRNYLRTRLYKIDNFTIYIHNTDEELKKLAPTELEYMERHFEILVELYNKQFLLKLPEALRPLDDNSGGINMVPEPNLSTSVFFKVANDINEIITIGDEHIELTNNGIYLMSYKLIRPLVMTGNVFLI